MGRMVVFRNTFCVFRRLIVIKQNLEDKETVVDFSVKSKEKKKHSIEQKVLFVIGIIGIIVSIVVSLGFVSMMSNLYG